MEVLFKYPPNGKLTETMLCGGTSTMPLAFMVVWIFSWLAVSNRMPALLFCALSRTTAFSLCFTAVVLMSDAPLLSQETAKTMRHPYISICFMILILIGF